MIPQIALVVHDALPGVGHGRYCLELAKRLQRQFAIHVWAHQFDPSGLPDVQFHRVPALRLSASSTILTFLWSSERLLKRHRYDVVHAQGLSCWGADLVTAHICNAARPARKLAALQQPFWRLIRSLERKFYQQQRVQRVIGVSQRVTDEIRKFYAWHKASDVIYHGTDCDQFRPARDPGEKAACRRIFGLAPAPWIWLFAGEAGKGLSQTLRALARFREAELLVISRSPLDRHQTEAKDLHVLDRVIFFGPTEQPSRAYQAADLFIYPSGYDAFGLVVAEAMASELPVLVSNQIGAAEWICNGVDGALFPPEDLESLCGLIAPLAADPAKAQRMGQAARQTALGHSWERCAAETAMVYRTMASAAKPKFDGDP